MSDFESRFRPVYPKAQWGKADEWKRDPTRFLLSVPSDTSIADLHHRLQAMGMELEGYDPEGQGKLGRRWKKAVNNGGGQFWVSSAGRSQPVDDRLKSRETFREALGGNLSVGWVSPVYQLETVPGDQHVVSPLPNVLNVKPVRGADETALENLMDSFKLKKIQEKSDYRGEYDYYMLTDPESRTVYDLPEQLLSHPDLIQEVGFENVYLDSGRQLAPGNALNQDGLCWNTEKIEAGGGGGQTGWDFSRGDPQITIAIIDTGCELDHPALAGQFIAGIDLHDSTYSPPRKPGDLRNDYDEHGTYCAGIIAAKIDNTTLDATGRPIGLAGLADKCKILPVMLQPITAGNIAEAMRRAARAGARVINLSLSNQYWKTNLMDFGLLDSAIRDVWEDDPQAVPVRPGLVICAAAGNSINGEGNPEVSYPASDDRIIACGASDEIDNRKTPSSPDGENWGSDFGKKLNVVAPGVKIPTADITKGTLREGKYHLAFGGTSAATPHVAALAALILSMKSDLKNTEVQDIIERRAIKTGQDAQGNPLTYTPPGSDRGWNEETGYGRINVLKALELVDDLKSARVVL